MTSIKKGSVNNRIDNQLLEDEIDLKNIFDTLNRHRSLIAKFIFSGLLLSFLYVLTTKRAWQGEFQIVLETGEGRESLLIDPSFKSLAGLDAKKNQLATQVGILKSPSVLINIFEFVRTQKALKNNSIKNLRFSSWKDKSLDIELEKGTTILNLAYRDTDKDLILPVLNKISATYQEYSGSKRKRELELSINYFEDQIDFYNKKNFESLRKAQQFAIDQDLSILQGDTGIDKEIPNAINIEEIRVKAANEIRIIDQQLLQIQKLEDNSEQINYLASTIPALEELTEKLKDIDSRMARLRVIYQDNDKNIIELKEERIFFIDLLKRQVTGFLIAGKADAQARLKSAERPEGVLIKYKQLLSNAAKDKATLDKLGTEYRFVLLEKARSEDPWELITTPTLLPFPVSPNKKLIFLFGLLSGGFIGSCAALILDKRKDIIFSMIEMESLGQWPLLGDLSVDAEESLELLATMTLSECDGSISLIVVGDIDDLELLNLCNSLKQLLNNREITITKDLKEANKSANLIVVTSLGITTKKELIKTRKKLLLLKTSVLGLISLNSMKVER